MARPNFIFIGPDKSGSTWIYDLLDWHPDAYVPTVKELLYFTEYYDRDQKWYLGHFENASQYKIQAEICHEYLFSRKAMERINSDLPEVKLMVNLREPVDRCFSAYLQLKKQGLTEEEFESAIKRRDDLLPRGHYASHLSTCLEIFDRDRLLVTLFDDLVEDPQQFADQIFDFLGLESKPLPDKLMGKRYPAARSRATWLSYVVKKLAWVARGLHLEELVGRVKKSALVKRVLYQPYSDDDKPSLPPEQRRNLKQHYREEIYRLEDMLEFDVASRWEYEDV